MEKHGENEGAFCKMQRTKPRKPSEHTSNRVREKEREIAHKHYPNCSLVKTTAAATLFASKIFHSVILRQANLLSAMKILK